MLCSCTQTETGEYGYLTIGLTDEDVDAGIVVKSSETEEGEGDGEPTQHHAQDVQFQEGGG